MITLSVVPLFAVILLGYVLRKTEFLSPQTVGQLNSFVYYIALPVTIVLELLPVPLSEVSRVELILGYPLIVLITAALVLVVAIPVPREQRGALAQISYRGNLAYFGLPIISVALGAGSLGFIGMLIGVGLVINVVLSIVILTILGPRERRSTVRGHLTSIATNPLIVATAVGALASLSGLELPAPVHRTLALVGQTSLPLVLIVVGYSLSFRGMRGRLGLGFFGAAVKLVVMPAIALLLMAWPFGATGMARDVVVLMAAMPTAAVSQSFAVAFGADEELTAAGISLNNLLCMVTVPIWLVLLQGPLAA